MKRVVIVFGLILGIGFWISSKNDEKSKTEQEESTTQETEANKETDENEKTEELNNEEKTESNSTENEPKTSETKNETNVTVVNKTETVSLSKPVETTVSSVTSSKKEVYADNISEVKVFLYEWGIDISEKQIKPGKVIFNVVNNGKFTHEFNIKNVKSYGKVLPGETKQFVISLRAGDFELYSSRRDDYDRDMKEIISIVR